MESVGSLCLLLKISTAVTWKWPVHACRHDFSRPIQSLPYQPVSLVAFLLGRCRDAIVLDPCTSLPASRHNPTCTEHFLFTEPSPPVNPLHIKQNWHMTITLVRMIFCALLALSRFFFHRYSSFQSVWEHEGSSQPSSRVFLSWAECGLLLIQVWHSYSHPLKLMLCGLINYSLFITAGCKVLLIYLLKLWNTKQTDKLTMDTGCD